MIKKITISILLSLASIAVLISIYAASAAAAVASPQTLTIIGAQGNPGETHPYTEFSLDSGQTWRRAYLYGSHPWGFVEGTNSWMNCGPSGFYCLGVDVLYRVRFILPDDFSNPQTTFQFKADNAVTILLNNNKVSDIDTQGTVTGNTYTNSSLKPGLNEMDMVLHDYGGWAGLNYKVTIHVDASSAPTLVTAPLSELPPPTFSSSPTKPTRENVSVTILFPADANVKEYSFNQADWFLYTSAIVMTDNGTVYARWKDLIGIPSTTGTYSITNIDKIPPPAPTLSATPTTPTNGNVKVILANWGDATAKEYRINGGVWQSVSEPAEVIMTASGTVEARGIDHAGNESSIGLLAVNNIVADEDPLKVTVAALNSTGTEAAVLFNHKLNIHTPLNIEKFHLKGTGVTISSVRYASDQVVVLQLNNQDAVINALPSITLDVDYGAVMDKGNKLILGWSGLPVRSQTDALQLRSQLLSLSASNPDGPIRIDNVVSYMFRTPADVTGDGVFDRNDVLFLLLQIVFQAVR